MTNEVYKAKLDANGNPVLDANGDKIMELVSYEIVPKVFEVEKANLIRLIDDKSSSKIFEGFTFDKNIFSLSISAQINWSNLLNIPEQMFPINISTKDDGIYVLQFFNVKNFYYSALTAKNTALQYGNEAKILIKNATTIAELETIATTWA